MLVLGQTGLSIIFSVSLWPLSVVVVLSGHDCACSTSSSLYWLRLRTERFVWEWGKHGVTNTFEPGPKPTAFGLTRCCCYCYCSRFVYSLLDYISCISSEFPLLNATGSKFTPQEELKPW